MPVTKIPFAYSLAAVAVVGSNDVVSPTVEPGYMYCVQHITVENETSNYTSLRLILVDGAKECVIAWYGPCVAANPDWYEEEIWLREGQYGLVRFAGCVANDQLRVYITGYKQTLPAFWEVN